GMMRMRRKKTAPALPDFRGHETPVPPGTSYCPTPLKRTLSEIGDRLGRKRPPEEAASFAMYGYVSIDRGRDASHRRRYSFQKKIPSLLNYLFSLHARAHCCGSLRLSAYSTHL